MAVHNIASSLQTQWEIDPDNTTVEFSIGRSVLHRVHGRFRDVRGSAVAPGGGLNGAAIEAEVDATSIDTGITVRDRHLHNSRFLHTQRFSTLSFRSTSVEDLGQDQLRVLGGLTIRGITHDVTFTATIEQRATESVRIAASTVFDRRDFKLGPRLMGLIVGNDITVRAGLVLRLQ